MNRICLSMIVKNEASVIRRCLDSVRPIVDCWAIVDTGSTDGTQQIIREHLAGLPGQLVERPWVDFAHNRSEALELARPRGGYSFVIDADEILELVPGFTLPELTLDSYNAAVHYGGCSYQRKVLVNNALPWRYEGVLHEYLRCDDAKTEQYLEGMITKPHRDGARARDPQTYRRDALLLERALIDDPQNARYVFYLAQSYRDAGDPELAIRWYRKRAALGGWPDEVWYSLYQIAQLEERRGTAWPEVMEHYLAAHRVLPDRAGPLYRLGLHYQARREFITARIFFAAAMKVPRPKHDRLFVEDVIYDVHLPVEYAVTCFHAGEHGESIAVNNRLLASGKLPPQLLEHVTRNRRCSVDAMFPRTATAAAPVKMKVLVPTRGADHRLDDLLDSLERQEMRDFETVFGDSGGVAFHDDEVIVRLEPDDRLADPGVLGAVRTAFEDPACLLLYGQYRLSSGAYGDAVPYESAAAFANGGPQRSLIAFRWKSSVHAAQGGCPPVDAIWRHAGFAATRFSDQVLTIAADRAPREQPAPRIEVHEAAPKISCLLVTRDRLPLVKRAIRSYADQTWPNRELLVVTDGTPRYVQAIESFVAAGGIANVRFVIPERDDLPLGALRNLSMREARGEILCQYDDDDASHPERLATQALHMMRAGARASFMTDHLQHRADQRAVFWIDWTAGNTMRGTMRLAPGTLMMFADPRFRYPEEGDFARRGEDSVLLEQLAASVPIAELSGMGHLYLYEWHGRNTFPKEHHYRMAQCGAPRAFLAERASAIRDALRYYAIARPAVVAGPDGPSFYVA